MRFLPAILAAAEARREHLARVALDDCADAAGAAGGSLRAGAAARAARSNATQNMSAEPFSTDIRIHIHCVQVSCG